MEPAATTVALKRPMLKPALRRLWRDASTIQLGIDPAIAIVLSGVDEVAARWLDSLDGTREWHAALNDAAASGLGAEQAASLLALLARGGAPHDAAGGPSGGGAGPGPG